MCVRTLLCSTKTNLVCTACGMYVECCQHAHITLYRVFIFTCSAYTLFLRIADNNDDWKWKRGDEKKLTQDVEAISWLWLSSFLVDGVSTIPSVFVIWNCHNDSEYLSLILLQCRPIYSEPYVTTMMLIASRNILTLEFRSLSHLCVSIARCEGRRIVISSLFLFTSLLCIRSIPNDGVFVDTSRRKTTVSVLFFRCIRW